MIDDEFKNRKPRISPDGLRIAFYSNRSGNYEIWSIGVDGLGLVQETNVRDQLVTTPLWSPGGRYLACEVGGSAAIFDLSKPLHERLPQPLPRPGPGLGFMAYAWSPDGKLLAGVRLRRDGSHEPGVWLYSLPGRRYRLLISTGSPERWLQDSRRLLYSDNGQLLMIDAFLSSRRLAIGVDRSKLLDFSISPDERNIYLTETAGDGQIWLINRQAHK